jgi:hypothetical protein
MVLELLEHASKFIFIILHKCIEKQDLNDLLDFFGSS